MANSLPYFRWYPADAETDNNYAALNDAELGFFHRCLNRSWINGGIPADPDDLARAMRVTPQYLAKVWVRVGNCFESSQNDPAKLVNRRQEIERAEAVAVSQRNSAAGKKSADVRSTRVQQPLNNTRYESDSVSGSVVGSEEKQDAPILREPVRSDLSPQPPVAFQRWELDEQYCQFRASYEASGMVPSPADWAEGHASWCALDWEQRLKAIDHARSADGAFIRLPMKYLRFHDWERKPRPPARPTAPKEKPMADQLRELGYGD